MQIVNINFFNPNFSAMKPNQFKGIDYAVVRKFKAPVEKFDNNSDLQAWATVKLQSLMNKSFQSEHDEITLDRMFRIAAWNDFLKSKQNEWSPAKILLIFSSMLKGMKSKNNVVPPPIRESVLEKSIDSLENSLNNHKDKPFDFNKIYQNDLEGYFLSDIPSDYTGWFIILSQANDPKHFKDNIERTRLLSCNSWCTTKTSKAEYYLENGDFHIYLEKGSPKIAVAFDGRNVKDIEFEKNNQRISQDYINELRTHLEEYKEFIDDDIEFIMDLYDEKLAIEL